MNHAPSRVVACPICSAENRGDAAYCFLCGQSLAGAEVSLAKKAGGKARPYAWVRRHLDWVMLVMALVAVILGVTFINQGVGLLLLFLSTIPLIHIVAGFRPSKSRFRSLFLSVPISSYW